MRPASDRPGGQFAASFDAVLADAGIEVVKISPRCPRASCFAEHLVLTVRTKFTDQMPIFGEQHLVGYLPGTPCITTRVGHTERCNCARRVRKSLPPSRSTAGSDADRSSAD